LARKFKYYHKSVRPSVQFNMVETVNGTFFRLLTQLELLETREMEMKVLGSFLLHSIQIQFQYGRPN
jgi:hypothetical protein